MSDSEREISHYIAAATKAVKNRVTLIENAHMYNGIPPNTPEHKFVIAAISGDMAHIKDHLEKNPNDSMPRMPRPVFGISTPVTLAEFALTLSICADQPDIARYLLEKTNTGPDFEVGYHNRHNIRLVHAAGAWAAANCLKLLISMGADMDAVSSNGYTARKYAEEKNRTEIIAILDEEKARAAERAQKNLHHATIQKLDTHIQNKKKGPQGG